MYEFVLYERDTPITFFFFFFEYIRLQKINFFP